MRFFQKKLVISYAAITFWLISLIITIVPVDFIGEQVFLGYFMSGNAVGAMFLNSPPPEPYRWPISVTYGLLANYRLGEPWEEILISAIGSFGGLVVAFFFGFMLFAAHSIMRPILYGGILLEKRRYKYARRTILWNTVIAFGAGLIYDFRFTSDMIATDTNFYAFLLFIVLVAVIISRQHALNKLVSIS
jgi:hypothetical protein